MRTDELVEHYNIVNNKEDIEKICKRINEIGIRNFKPTFHFEKRVRGYIRGFDRNLVF